MTLSHTGLQVWFSTSVPATNDDAGFEALTDWEKISGYAGGFQLGFSTSIGTVPDLESGVNIPYKQMQDGQDSTGSFFKVDGDDGQKNIRLAADDGQTVGSIKLIFAEPNAAPASGDEVHYAQGLWHGYMKNPASGDNDRGFQVSFRQGLAHVEATEPA